MQTTEGAEVMTDFQFKALMSMVLDIVNKSKDLEEVKRSIKNWLPENWLKTITTTKIQMTGKNEESMG